MSALGQASSSSSPSPGTSAGPSTTTEYVVRAPSNSAKKFSMIKFSSGTNIDFLKLTNTSVKMERQNNLKEYKSVHNIDAMPKFGAGSEYGREQKEEARRKKYGINVKRYNPADQPWLMKVGKGKDAKRFKGGREGTITENTSYYIFTQCADGAFDAYPVEEWYGFQPIVNYKYLNSEEAEEEFSRRDKTMNLFSIMVKKRIRNEEDGGEPDEPDKKEKTKAKKDRSLILTDMDDWTVMSDEEDAEEEGEDGEKKPKKEKKPKGQKQRKKKNAKINDNDEAIEESDEGDFDDREVDYITDSGSESDMDEKDKADKYNDKGVDQEHGLKKLIDSEEESSEDEEEKKEEEDQDEEVGPDEEGGGAKEKKSKKKKKEAKEGAAGDDSDSSSSSSESDDSDIEKNEEKFSSVLFMQGKKNEKKGSSRSSTPTIDKSDAARQEVKQEAVKRKMEVEDSPDQAKKMRTESPVSPSASMSSGEITEEAIRRYLMRKPMTAKDVVQKFRSKKPQMSKEQMTQKIGQLLKKINPDRKYVNSVLYLSVKKTD